MRLDQIFHSELLNDNLMSDTKAEVLAELIQLLIKNGMHINPAKTLDVLLQREKLGTTGIGDGVAIPHGKISDLDKIVVSFGRSQDGIAFDSVDGKPVKLFFLLLAPENSSGEHLKALAQISKMLKTPSLRKKLIEAKTKADLYGILVGQDKS